MAITIKEYVQRIEVTPGAKSEDATITVVLAVETDDPKDDRLPVVATQVISLINGDDYSNLPELVGQVASGIWSNNE